jgi:hypothetical protein
MLSESDCALLQIAVSSLSESGPQHPISRRILNAPLLGLQQSPAVLVDQERRRLLHTAAHLQHQASQMESTPQRNAVLARSFLDAHGDLLNDFWALAEGARHLPLLVVRQREQHVARVHHRRVQLLLDRLYLALNRWVHPRWLG